MTQGFTPPIELIRQGNPLLRDLYEDIVGKIPAIPDKQGQAKPE